MKIYCVLMFLLLALSCNERKDNRKVAIVNRAVKLNRIEAFLYTLEGKDNKKYSDLGTKFKILDSLQIKIISSTIYSLQVDYDSNVISCYDIPDGNKTFVIGNPVKNLFLQFNFSKWNGGNKESVTIDEAYKQMHLLPPVKPISSGLDRIEPFLNLFENPDYKINLHDLQPIFTESLGLKKISNKYEIDSMLNILEKNFESRGIITNKRKKLSSDLTNALKYSDNFSAYILNEGILCVNLVSHQYNHLRVFRIQ